MMLKQYVNSLGDSLIKVVEKTIIHLEDDKGWTKIEEVNGDFACGRIYRIPKYTNNYPISLLQGEPVVNEKMKYYEFDLIKGSFELLDSKKEIFVKHLYFEMK